MARDKQQQQQHKAKASKQVVDPRFQASFSSDEEDDDDVALQHDAESADDDNDHDDDQSEDDDEDAEPDDAEDEPDHDDNDDDEDADEDDNDAADADDAEDADDDDDDDDDDEAAGAQQLSARSLAEFQAEQDQRGVIYISRIPPFMQPTKIRHIFAQYGEVLRVYLTPESATAKAKRKKLGGCRKDKFIDGWVEFGDKRIARRVAEALNNTPIGVQYSRFYAADIWNIKYLPKFKWHHLTERIAYEKRTREARLRAELLQAKRETNLYLENVAKAHGIEHQKERLEKKKSTAKDGTTTNEAADSSKAKSKPPAKRARNDAPAATSTSTSTSTSGESMSEFNRIRMQFRQRKAVGDGTATLRPDPTLLHSVLGDQPSAKRQRTTT